jgi:hypothetical protein
MSNKSQDNQPILVEDPETGEMIDVYPVLMVLSSFENKSLKENLRNARSCTDKCFTLMATGMSDETLQSDPMFFRNNMFFMSQLRDMFYSMSVVKNHNAIKEIDDDTRN